MGVLPAFMIPSLEMYSKSIKKEKCLKSVLKIAIPVLAAALGSVLTWILSL